MRLESFFAGSAALMLATVANAAGDRVLFIGNSFTFGAGSAVRFYRSDAVTDLNDEGIGGVPALFESFTRQAGLDYDVALETRGGTGLDFHLAEKRDEITSRRWDIVVAHGYSTLDADAPRNPAKLVATSRELAELLRDRNADVQLFLTATWSRADQVYPTNGAWAGTAIDTMARDIRAAYDQAAAGAGASVIPVGEAWNRAIATGVADANPYDGIDAGKLDLWTYDHYHASTHGYYLEALVIFGSVTGRDPRSLGERECSAFELGLSRTEVRALQQIAFDELATTRTLAQNAPPPPAEGNPQRCSVR
ncbi:MAG TPA: PEP-CTERM sorting domain-containing protein [Gammaproteobacteria bacterium]